MTTDTRAGSPRIPSIVHVLNPLVRRLLHAGMPMGQNALLTVRGRTSGEPRTFPVTILDAGGHRYVFSAFGEVNWVRNLRAAGEATIRRGRRDEAVTAVELTPDEAALIMKAAMAPALKIKVVGPLVGSWYDLTLDSSPADYLDSARRHAGFELRPSR